MLREMGRSFKSWKWGMGGRGGVTAGEGVGGRGSGGMACGGAAPLLSGRPSYFPASVLPAAGALALRLAHGERLGIQLCVCVCWGGTGQLPKATRAVGHHAASVLPGEGPPDWYPSLLLSSLTLRAAL